ncbi:MAG: DUF4416 family protein [Candidatus Omnitrophota bacterium]|jgi:hypothetical protein
MGSIKRHPPVKLIVGFIFKESQVEEKAKGLLEKRFGKIDFESPCLAFTHTDYYEKEFGSGLKKKFISFKKLIAPDDLAGIKKTTNQIEKRLSRRQSRLINIDPGYLDLSKLILATTKDYKHRIYLKDGIYAEATLFYQNKTFTPWDWTYPDYKQAEYLAIFEQIRDIYKRQIE